jgi:hypothetical protein
MSTIAVPTVLRQIDPLRISQAVDCLFATIDGLQGSIFGPTRKSVNLATLPPNLPRYRGAGVIFAQGPIRVSITIIPDRGYEYRQSLLVCASVKAAQLQA